MRIAVLANDDQWAELLEGSDEKMLLRISSLQDEVVVDAFIVLKDVDITNAADTTRPIIVNAVIQTLGELKAGKNILRINGWTGFIKRNTWEIAGEITTGVRQVFEALNRQLIEVKDEPGLVAARPISMVVNEAYFALGEEVSTKEEIDTAMKLGTNYPYGPFEWADKIGVKNIYRLLQTLAANNKRYIPAPLLEKEALA